LTRSTWSSPVTGLWATKSGNLSLLGWMASGSEDVCDHRRGDSRSVAWARRRRLLGKRFLKPEQSCQSFYNSFHDEFVRPEGNFQGGAAERPQWMNPGEFCSSDGIPVRLDGIGGIGGASWRGLSEKVMSYDSISKGSATQTKQSEPWLQNRGTEWFILLVRNP
jgi:hypothetical protein